MCKAALPGREAHALRRMAGRCIAEEKTHRRGERVVAHVMKCVCGTSRAAPLRKRLLATQNNRPIRPDSWVRVEYSLRRRALPSLWFIPGVNYALLWVSTLHGRIERRMPKNRLRAKLAFQMLNCHSGSPDQRIIIRGDEQLASGALMMHRSALQSV